MSSHPPILLTTLVALAAAAILMLSTRRPDWGLPLHLTAAVLLGTVAGWAEDRIWWLRAIAVATAIATLWVAAARSRSRTREAQAKADQLANQVDRRISELFSLRELSYVLSQSIQLDQIADQVAKYAARFLQADGAIVVLADGELLRVVAATGTLEPLLGEVSDGSDSLIKVAIDRNHIEVSEGTATAPVALFAGMMARSAAVAPLRARDSTLGALAVADRQGGALSAEDLWLLSTVATNASVVMTNSRLYEMVRRSEAEWETTFNALTEGIAVVGPDGNILRANEALATIAELPESELVGRNFSEMILGTSEVMTELISAAYRGERTIPLVVRPENSHKVLRLTAAPLDEAERGTAVILIEDVTEQRILEAQIIQNDKMASIGQLVSGVAHELNNPLTSIAGLAELLLERPPHPELPHEHLRVIYDQAERAGRIVRNLLTFARKGVPEKAAVDLNDVVVRTSLLIMYELQLHGIELETELSSDPAMILGDRYELQQVLLNLITNAVQAVSRLEPGKPRRITLSTTLLEGEAVLRVRDTGPGVPSHFIPYLFTPFFTTKAPGEGTGLGLSLSYGLVKAHEGLLEYRSPPEGGAEFKVTLPRSRSEIAQLPEVRIRGENGRSRRRRILVVDEDPSVHRLLNALFTPQGYTVEAVRSGEQGLKLAREREFDLVITDVGVSVGPEELFAGALLDACPGVGCRLLVACSSREELPAPLAQQTVHWVRKPFNLRDLRSVANEILSTPPQSPASRA
ncbi:MAG TPA: ATP-binding protein [Gemmatimonadales bacterium]|nr:ATP-binding protein [Gemmatimonadales bacterium]